MRPELEPLPPYMADLPLDSRGYPVPWFVQWLPDESGKLYPEFRAMSPEKWLQAVKHSRCWVCGKQLGSYLSFVIGPMCGITRTTSEPPCHRTCAEWSARNCPFLSRPHMVRRDMDYPDIQPGPGISLQRNPGATIVWTTRSYRVFNDGKGAPLIEVGEPTSLSLWSEGRPGARAEIDASIKSGLPLLLEATNPTGADLKQIQTRLKRFQKLLPVA